MSMRTPLARVRGLGTANEGTGHFWRQRLTSLANVPLTIFVIALGVSFAGAGHEAVAARLASPFVAVPLIATILSFAYHMQLGMQVIIDDYVHSELARVLAHAGNIFFCIAVALAGAFAVLKLGLGG